MQLGCVYNENNNNKCKMGKFIGWERMEMKTKTYVCVWDGKMGELDEFLEGMRNFFEQMLEINLKSLQIV